CTGVNQCNTCSDFWGENHAWCVRENSRYASNYCNCNGGCFNARIWIGANKGWISISIWYAGNIWLSNCDTGGSNSIIYCICMVRTRERNQAFKYHLYHTCFCISVVTFYRWSNDVYIEYVYEHDRQLFIKPC